MKVFVSSTYIDLIEYRKAAERAINILDQQFKGMEYFGARPEEPKAACLKEIEQADVFVGIYAHRYGFVPDGDSKSITEQEFDHAKNLPKPIFCYRVSAKQPWLPEFIEEGDAKKKLADFLNRLGKEFIRQEFTSPEDLLAKISADLSRYLAERGSVAVITHPLPPLPYFVHPYPLQANFTGRVKERHMLSDWLTRGERKTESILSLCAIGGMGKSALAWYWLNHDILPQATALWSLTGMFWWSFYEERDFGTFLSRAIEYVSGGKVDPKSIASDRERVDTLVNLLRQSRFLFVLDGFERVLRAYARMDAAYRGDEVDTDPHNDYRACVDPNASIFLKSMVSGAMLTKTLITTRLHPRELDEMEGACHEDLVGMQPADAVEFFHKQGIQGTHTEIENACAPYGFHPLTLRLLAGALKQDPRYHADINNAPNVDMLEADKEKRMQRMLEFAYNSLPPQEQKLLSQLSAFRSPMKYETIEGIFTAENTESAEKTNSSVTLSEAKRLTNGELRDSSLPAVAQNDNQSSTVNFVFPSKRELARAISNLAERGLYMRDASTDTFDLHPVIRRYCYDRLADKQQTHAIFIVYFEKIETPQKIQTLADLQPTIELYHHTVRAGRYDEARTLFRDRLQKQIFYQLGAYQLQIELLRALFPDGEDKPPRLRDESAQAWTLNELANSYALVGQSRRAVPLKLLHNTLREKASDKGNLAIGLGNVAQDQIRLGELKAVEQNLRRSIEICREIKDKLNEAIGHQELGRVLAYRSQFAEAEQELLIAQGIFDRQFKVIWNSFVSVVRAYRALHALFREDVTAALEIARDSREWAERVTRESYPHERDFIRAEWMIGAALTLTLTLSRSQSFGYRSGQRTGEGTFAEAEKHLQEALSRDRKIGLVDHEAAILLEFAKLRKAEATQSGQKSESRRNELMQESFNFANEALEIAERCEYRLQEAEIHNFLAEWWMAEAESSKQKAVGREPASVAEAIAKAKEHAERAKERAWCDGPPYHYKVAYEQAEKMLKTIDKETR